MSNGAASISDYLILIKKIINQVPSSHRNNNEWVTVFSLAWQYQWGDPILYKNLGDGSKNPCWLALDDIERESEKMPMGINAALRLFLQRRNILIPILRL